MLRKYFTEFGLNVYTSYKTLIPVEHLDKVQDDAKYHIYMILGVPRIIIEKDSIVTQEDSIDFSIKQINRGEEIEYKIEKVSLIDGLDHNNIQFNVRYPYTQLNCKIENSFLKSYYENNRRALGCSEEEFINLCNTPIDAQVFLNQYLYAKGDPLEMKVLYIGQAYGKHGERLAQDRLTSHETLQKILTDCHSKYPDKRIFILLLEMTPMLNTTFDGITKEYSANEKEESEHFKNGLLNLPLYNQVINITEAALINYFKPIYNTNFVENFPCDRHKGYKQYYDLDYNCMSVELDLEFDYIPRIVLYSDSSKIQSSFDFVQYNLFNDPNRKNMYEIFSKQ